MAKYADVKTLGSSGLVPYIKEEESYERHYRRFEAANNAMHDAIRWCRARGVSLTVSNSGHHWQFKGTAFGRRARAEWWPQTAKLVFDGKYRRGLHAHDWRQVVGEIARRWGLRTEEM
jgi:hypothetical protein